MVNQNCVLFDNLIWADMLPLTYTRPASELRVGVTTIKEKWQQYFNSVSDITAAYLQEKYPANIVADNYFINSAVIPNNKLVEEILRLKNNQYLFKGDFLIAFRSPVFEADVIKSNGVIAEYTGGLISIITPWDIFEKNGQVLLNDFDTLTKGRISQPISSTNRVLSPENIFIEPGAKVEFATINASEGPVYIANGAEIMEGALIRGPLALCNHATIKMGAKIYGATTIGPHCKAAGEIHNSVLTGYSNKGHDGYLGNAVLGEWCNIGADSNNSNLKNNYEKVKMWSYRHERFVDTGLQFCGLIMGDHSKCGINTMFNTGTVVGVSANIFGSGFPRNFVPSFSWGGAAGFTTYSLKKAVDTAKIVLERRKMQLAGTDLNILEHVFKATEKYRR
ncbi:MAG: GlmU family protein [Bacteroidales bacterium]|nr:GlmU family protein [Bacteroidales bacterium]